MYLRGTQTEIAWILAKTVNTVLQAGIATIVIDPDGETDYSLVNNLIAPTVDATGLITTYLTPDKVGMWEIKLVKGSSANYTETNRVMLYVFDNLTEVPPITDGSGLDIIEI